MAPELSKNLGEGALAERERRRVEEDGKSKMTAEEAFERVARTNKSRGKPEEPISGPEVPKGATQEVIEKVATAGMGALIAEAIDFIQDKAEKTRVDHEIHRWDKEYDNDPFKDYSYGDLRAILATGEREGKKLSDDELVQARASRRLRVKEAERYGVMSRAEGILKERMIEADWRDYPSKITNAANSAEIEAAGVNEYRHNPRIRGVVRDAVAATEYLARADGYRQISDLNDPDNIKTWTDKLHTPDAEAEIRKTEEEIRQRVSWDPFPNSYAGYVNQETPRQREEKLALGAAERQRQHELELAQARSGRETGQPRSDEILKKMEELGRERTGWNFDVTRMPPTPEGIDHSAFDPSFVKQLGLPTVIYEIPSTFSQKTIRGYDTATLLTKLFNSGDLLPMFSYQNIMYTLGSEISDAEVYKAFDGFHNLNNAVVPLVLGRFKTGEGSFYSMVGENGTGGILNKGQGNLDMGEIVPAFRNDTLAKRALAILLAADGVAEDGYKVGEINPSDQALANELKPRFRDLMRTNVIKGGRPALNKEPGYSQRECVAYIDNEVAGQIAKHLGCDTGRVDLMVMLYTALCGGPRMVEYREAHQRFPVLRTVPCKVNPRTGLVEGDVVMAPMLRKLKIADDAKVRIYNPGTRQMEVVKERDPETGKMKDKIVAGLGFGYVERQLNLRGIDGLFDALLMLKDGHDLWKFYPAQVFIAMKKVEDIQDGNDSFSDINERKKEIAKLVDPFAAGDPPQIRTETLETIKRMPVYGGKGQLAEAGASFSDNAKDDLQYALDQTGLTGFFRFLGSRRKR